MFNQEACDRFHLKNGQFFAVFRLKNQQWFLNGTCIGFGDLRELDIDTIQKALTHGERFEGFNEHHNTSFMRRSNPCVVITKESVEFPTPVRVSDISTLTGGLGA